MLSCMRLQLAIALTCISVLEASLPPLAVAFPLESLPTPSTTMISSVPLSATSDSEITAELEFYLQSHHEHRQFMGAVMVVKNGETLLNRGYGMASLEQQIPNTPETKFRIGSVTKQFTAAAILQLQDQGLVDVQAPVATYLPDYPNKIITLHHLLTHSAGLPNLTSFPDYFEWMKLPTTLDRLIARFQYLPLEFEPGTQYRYSNSGYILLTKVIETVSGQSYADYMATNLLIPLGMHDTGYEQSTTIIPKLARGYRLNASGYQQAEYTNMTTTQGGGGLYSTVADLVRWNQALFEQEAVNKGILSDLAVAAMTSPQISLGIQAAPDLHYGYGLVVAGNGTEQRIGHGGGVSGFVASLVYLPEQAITIVVLSNVESINPEPISADLAAILLGHPYEHPQPLNTFSVDSGLLRRYEGTYQLTSQFQITLTVKDGQLYAQGTGQPEIALYPDSETEFFALAPELRIVFNPASNGIVDSLTLVQSGQNSVAPRVN